MMYTVKPLANWLSETKCLSYFTLFSERNNIWKNIKLTDDDSADYYFIINYPPPYALDNEGNYKYDKKRTIIFQMEPSIGIITWGEWSTPNYRDFLQVRTHKLYPNNSEWHFQKSFTALTTMEFIKTKSTVSAVISNKISDVGHLKRINFIKYVEQTEPELFDVYGRCESLNFKNYKGTLPPMDKGLAYYDYKYTFIAENNSEYNYFTEKIVDSIVSECLCFYWGAPNLEEYFGEAFVRLSLIDYEADLKLIKQTMLDGEYERRLPIIKKVKQQILCQYQLFPTLHSVINSSILCLHTYCINLNRRPDRRARMINLLDKVGFSNYDFFEAVDGRDIVPTLELYDLFKDNDFGSRRGFIGCAQSHHNIWKELCTQEKDGFYFILEDDVIFHKYFTQSFDRVCSTIYEKDSDWDICLFGYSTQELGNNLASATPTPKIIDFKIDLFIGGTFGYLISKRGARKLCNFIDRNRIQHGIDYLFKKYRDEIGLRIYELENRLIYSKIVSAASGGDTDIQIFGNSIDWIELFKSNCSWDKLVQFLETVETVA